MNTSNLVFFTLFKKAKFANSLSGKLRLFALNV